MENQTPPVKTPQPTPPSQPVVKEPVHEVPGESVGKQRKTIIYPVVILLILISVIAGYLGYQNYQLKQQFKDQAIQTPQPTEMPQETPAPTESPTETANPTANWKTHTASTYQVKYPNDITFKEQGAAINLSMWGPTQKEGTELFDGFSITFESKEISNTTLETLIQARIDEINNQDLSEVVSGPDPITINNYKGLTYTEEGLGIFEHIILESGKENGMYMFISKLVSDPGNLGFSETVDQILSTFGFTN